MSAFLQLRPELMQRRELTRSTMTGLMPRSETGHARHARFAPIASEVRCRSEATRLVPQSIHTAPRSAASPQSTTSSALISIAAGIVSPSDSNVFLLITRRKWVGCSNGRSAGRLRFLVCTLRGDRYWVSKIRGYVSRIVSVSLGSIPMSRAF
jgi:hypothetical protein